MRRILLIFSLFITISNTSIFAQSNEAVWGLRFGYGVHNTRASRFNKLINHFNDERYPLEVEEVMPNINFLVGWHFGLDYRLNESFTLNFVLKNKHQRIGTEFQSPEDDIVFLFRQNSLMAGVSMPLGDEGLFQHAYGGGVLLGYTSVFTAIGKGDRPERSEMINIDHTGLFGIQIHYEAKIVPSRLLNFYIRPNLELSLPTQVRRLDDFFQPSYTTAEGWQYGDGNQEKFTKGSLGGIGIEAGFLLLLPDFSVE